MIYVILGGRLGKDDPRDLDYELAVGDPVNVITGFSGGAPVYEQRIIKSLTLEQGNIRVKTGVGKLYCPCCDIWNDHDVLECSVWAGELSEQERREVGLRLSRESINAKWARAEWIAGIDREVERITGRHGKVSVETEVS